MKIKSFFKKMLTMWRTFKELSILQCEVNIHEMITGL